MSAVSARLPVTQNPDNSSDIVRAMPICNPDGTNVGGSASASSAGVTASASFTPTAAAYAAGNTMGAAQAFVFTYADGTALADNCLINIRTAILRIDVTALQSGEGAYSLQPYNITPPSALANNSAWTLNGTTDLAAYRGRSIALGVPVDLGSALAIATDGLDITIRTGAAGTLWQYLVTNAAFTATTAIRQVTLNGLIL